SMVYTEYFARGTTPTSFCDVHTGAGMLTKVAGVFGVAEKPAPVRLEDLGGVSLPVAIATSGASASHVETQPPPAPPAPKKRGFWSRVFGVGKDPQPQQSKKKNGG